LDSLREQQHLACQTVHNTLAITAHPLLDRNAERQPAPLLDRNAERPRPS